MMRRGFLFVVFFILGVVGIICWNAHATLKQAERQNRHEIEQTLVNGCSQQSALVTVWLGALENQIASFVDLDIVRLFASEVDGSNVPASEILAYIREGRGEIPKELADRAEGVSRLAQGFARRNDFKNVKLLDRDLKTYLATDERNSFDENELSTIAKAVRERKPCVLPVRKIDKEFVACFCRPVFAPTYVDPSGDRVVAVACTWASVQKIVAAMGRSDQDGFFTSAVVEKLRDGFVLLDPLYPGGKRPLDWTDVNKNLAVRDMPTRAETVAQAYTLARPLEGLPWFVVQGRTVEQALAPFKRLKENVVMETALLVGLVSVFVLAFWWWGVGRRDRAQAEEIKELYDIVTEQKQVLDSVNSALSSAIVLNDLSGKIYYVNQRFADMAHMDAMQMTGLSAERLPKDLGMSLAAHTTELCDKPKRTDFRDRFRGKDGVREYLTSCSPCVDEEDYLVGIVSVYNDITELVRAEKKAKRLVDQTIKAMVSAIEARDPYLEGQSRNTADLAVHIATAMGKSESCETLKVAAMLSHIGMIQLPKEILNKKGALTNDEREILQTHVEFAGKTLEKIDFGLPVLPAVVQMHERMDGSGYPEHLSGDEICMNARILAVADTFCALVAPRSWRRAHTAMDALDMMRARENSYDKDVLAALSRFMETEEGLAWTGNLSPENKGMDA